MSTELLDGSCHCGTVKFEVRTAVVPAARCNCSLCRRKGALMTPPFAAGELKILSGEEALTLWRANIGCLEGIDPYTLEASVANGASLSVVDVVEDA
jgi:hypothetical protein